MEKGTEIPRYKMKVGERYCLGKGLESKYTFVVDVIGKYGIHIIYEDGVAGSFNLADSNIVYANPFTELEKALS